MRTLVLLTATLALIPTARADLFTAQLAYQKGDYEHAYRDYRDLAELGQPLAQYNLAIMYAKGQGVRQSDLNAYAWATLAAESGEARGQSLADELRVALAPGSDKIAADIVAPFSSKALAAKLLPKISEDEGQHALCKGLHLGPIDYPLDADKHGVQGNVYTQFTVMPDGTTRSPRTLYAVPAGVFDNSVRTAVLHLHYPVRAAGGEPGHCEVMFRFVAHKEPSWAYPELNKLLADTSQKAQAGDVQAEFLYGMLLAGLPQLRHKPQDALPWFLKAAQSGFRQAQYAVGSSLLFGRGCQCEENKALVWLGRAAEADQSNAQVTLAQLALRGTPDAADMQRAKFWLERAAASGDHDGMLYLSALLAAASTPEFRDPPRALSLLEKVKRDLGGDPSEFEIRAAAQAESGTFEKAVNSEHHAIDMAGKLGWDLAPLNDRLAHYQAHQAWYGNLLTL